MSRKSTLNLKLIKSIIIVSKFSSIFVEAITKSKIKLMLMYQRCYEIRTVILTKYFFSSENRCSVKYTSKQVDVTFAKRIKTTIILFL